MLDDGDPDRLYDELRPPDGDDFDLEPDDQPVDEAMFALPEDEDEAEDWLNGSETAGVPAGPPSDPIEDEDPGDWSPMRRAVVLGGAAALGAVAILVAVLRRRG